MAIVNYTVLDRVNGLNMSTGVTPGIGAVVPMDNVALSASIAAWLVAPPRIMISP